MTIETERTIRILFIASEADPFIKVGGLADVSGQLPRILRGLSPLKTGGYTLDIRLVIPEHGAIDRQGIDFKPCSSFPVPRQGKPERARASVGEYKGLPVYLIGGNPVPPEAGVYSLDTEKDGEKYAFFSLACLELARALDWKPDILHANDWHTAVAIYALKTKLKDDPFFAETRTVLTMHNLPFMGAGTQESLKLYEIPPSEDTRLPKWARLMPLPLGLLTADKIVAVSPNYAREVMSPAFGCSLHNFIKTRRDSLTGILNGMDYTLWNPETDPNIAAQYSHRDLSGKKICKAAIQREFYLEENPNIPLMVYISRMDQQKGIDLALDGLRQMNQIPWQAIILGTGDPVLEQAARQLEYQMPDRVRAVAMFDSKLSRRLYAGGDLILMPSRYEPCGLSQLIGMRYGTLPIARQTGGLKDTIERTTTHRKGTGFLFQKATPFAFADAAHTAIETFHNRKLWKSMQEKAMRKDFSWHRSAQEYVSIYKDLLGLSDTEPEN